MKRIWRLRPIENSRASWFEELVTARKLKLDFDYERDLHDPFLLLGMKEAVARLEEAVRERERLMIFADYDADGVPGAAVLTLFFQKIGFTNFSVYLPDRHIEDYGLNTKAIDEAVAEGVKLIVTIDCGIANAAEVAYARERGIEVIVTDHHLVPSVVPEAVAIVNPKQAGDEYPEKNLCGAGVVYKLVQALALTLNVEPRGWEKWLLDLVAIATVSDMVPLTGENRALVHFGLRVLRRSPRPGLVELCRVLRLKQSVVGEDDIAFLIGPRLNAASRMAHAREAFELLTTPEPAVAATIARRLEALNRERRTTVEIILSQAARQIEKQTEAPLLVLGQVDWSLGVLGLAASRMVEEFKRPVFLWGKNGHGLVKGSCRSDGSVNVVELMRAVPENFFTNLGGHTLAGGFSLGADKLPELETHLITAWDKVSRSESVIEDLILEAELELTEINSRLLQKISQLGPFGLGNPKPIFLLRAVTIAAARYFGEQKNHLELELVNERGARLKAVSFFQTFPDLNFASGQKIDVAATLELSYFRFTPELRLRLVDVR